MVGNVAADLEAGEELFLLSELPNRPEVPRRGGKKLNRRVGYRWAINGVRGVKLETLVTPAGRASSPSAIIRFFTALSSVSTAEPIRTPTRRARDQRRAEDALASAGFKL